MHHRCNDRSNKAYGGRGIAVAERWLVYDNFLKDMGPCPEGHSIERRDVDGDYEPGNCCWLPRWDQWKNKQGLLVKTELATRRVRVAPGVWQYVSAPKEVVVDFRNKQRIIQIRQRLEELDEILTKLKR